MSSRTSRPAGRHPRPRGGVASPRRGRCRAIRPSDRSATARRRPEDPEPHIHPCRGACDGLGGSRALRSQRPAARAGADPLLAAGRDACWSRWCSSCWRAARSGGSSSGRSPPGSTTRRPRTSNDGDYRNAIRRYDEFLGRYPGDSRASKAQVLRALANVRQFTATTGASWTNALEAERAMVRTVSGEPSYRDSSTELAELVLQDRPRPGRPGPRLGRRAERWPRPSRRWRSMPGSAGKAAAGAPVAVARPGQARRGPRGGPQGGDPRPGPGRDGRGDQGGLVGRRVRRPRCPDRRSTPTWPRTAP